MFSLERAGLCGALLFALALSVVGVAAAGSQMRDKAPVWTKSKVEKKLLSTRIKCPRAIYWQLAGSSNGFANAQRQCAAGLNPKYQQTVNCGVTSACDFTQCCADQVAPVTETEYKIAKWMVDTHALGQPISWAKCVRAGPRSFTCGAQPMEVTDYAGLPTTPARPNLERFCLRTTTRPAFAWKATAAFWQWSQTPTTWKPSDPGLCGHLAVRP